MLMVRRRRQLHFHLQRGHRGCRRCSVERLFLLVARHLVLVIRSLCQSRAASALKNRVCLSLVRCVPVVALINRERDLMVHTDRYVHGRCLPFVS